MKYNPEENDACYEYKPVKAKDRHQLQHDQPEPLSYDPNEAGNYESNFRHELANPMIPLEQQPNVDKLKGQRNSEALPYWR